MVRVARLRRGDFHPSGMSTQRFHGTFFSLSVSSLPTNRRTSFTCVVSKKVASKATARNLIKRRCREATRAQLRAFPAKDPLALVFRAKKDAARASFLSIETDIAGLFDKISNPRYNLLQ